MHPKQLQEKDNSDWEKMTPFFHIIFFHFFIHLLHEPFQARGQEQENSKEIYWVPISLQIKSGIHDTHASISLSGKIVLLDKWSYIYKAKSRDGKKKEILGGLHKCKFEGTGLKLSPTMSTHIDSKVQSLGVELSCLWHILVKLQYPPKRCCHCRFSVRALANWRKQILSLIIIRRYRELEYMASKNEIKMECMHQLWMLIYNVFWTYDAMF